MKIAYISTVQVPSDRANSIQVMKMCQAMTQLGHDVVLILPGDSGKRPEDQDWEMLSKHYGLKSRFEIQYLAINKGWQRRIFDVQAVRLARSSNADLIYARSIPPAVIGLLQHHSVILELHQMPSGRFGPVWFHLFLKLNGHKRLVIITHSLKQQLLKKYQMEFAPANLVVAPSGVDLERFASLPEPEDARRQLALRNVITGVCTGHLYAGRGMAHFLNLAKRLPEVQFVWVGGRESEVRHWQVQAEESSLSNVIFTGFKPNEIVPLYQAAADFLMIPYEDSISGSGGDDISSVSSPMKVFEYLASGRPIISSDLPVLHEVLTNQNAIFCPAGDVISWENAIHQVISSPALRTSLGNQAKMDANSYSWIDRCRKILANF